MCNCHNKRPSEADRRSGFRLIFILAVTVLLTINLTLLILS